MPPRRKYASRRPAYRRYSAPRKYGRKYGRSRFTKKKFARNNINQLTMRAPLASRLLRVKLPWIKTFDSTVPISGSSSFAFQGNGIVPYTVNGQTSLNGIGPGDTLPAGELEYSQFYDRYFINGSSIKIEAVNMAIGAAAASSPLLRCVLLAIPFLNDPSDNWQANKAQLDAYTYEQLLAWPYAKWRMIASNSGGASRMVMKMFRKTKNMCGLKDLRDNQEYSGRLTDGSLSVPNPPDLGINPSSGFIYYFRVFNTSTTNTTIVAITIRMSLYCTMTNREFNPTQTITS